MISDYFSMYVHMHIITYTRTHTRYVQVIVTAHAGNSDACPVWFVSTCTHIHVHTHIHDHYVQQINTLTPVYAQVIVTAHAGDSDACLIRFTQPQHAGQKSVMLFAKWLTKEHTLYSPEERKRKTCLGGVLADSEGEANLKFKVCAHMYVYMDA